MNILHHEEILPKLFDKVVDGNGVRMRQGCCRARLTAKALNRLEIVLIQGTQHLDGNQTFYPVIPGLEYTRHTTGGDMLANFVPSGNQCAFKLRQCLTSKKTWDHALDL